MIYEHSLVKHDDLSRVNAAFFTMNGFISMGFLFFIAGRPAAGALRRSSDFGHILPVISAAGVRYH